MAKSAEDRLVDTFLPLIPWTMQKLFGLFLSREEWHWLALVFVPAPKTIASRFRTELAYLMSPALDSPSARRKVRAYYQDNFRSEERNCGDDGKRMRSAALNYMLEWRKSLEAKGYKANWARVRKIRDCEAEIDAFYNQLATQPDLPRVFGPVSQTRAEEIVSLCWEFAMYGQGGSKPNVTRDSPFLAILGIDPVQIETMMPQEVVPLVLDRFLAWPQIYDNLPEERKLGLLKWVIKTYRTREREPATTPEALNNAVIAGLVHKAIKVVDKETGEVVGTDIEDKSGVKPGDLLTQRLSSDDIIELLGKEGINKSDLTDKTWRLIFHLNDAFNDGAEIGSKKGLSLNAYFGDDSTATRKQLSRLRDKVTKLKAKKM